MIEIKPKNIKIHPEPKGYVDRCIFLSFDDSEDQTMYSCQNAPDGENLLTIEEDARIINRIKNQIRWFTGICS